MDQHDDSEEVIYEFDLNSSATKCDLFAFSAKDYPFDTTKSRHTTFESIRVKPNAKQYEINLNFKESDNFYRKKNNDLLLENEGAIKNDKLMKCKILRSNYLPQTQIKYGICYLTKRKKVLDIVPIDRVFDFQTDFTYFEKEDYKSRTTNRTLDDKCPGESCSTLNESADESPLMRSPLSKSTESLIDITINPPEPNSPPPPSIELQNFTLRYESNFESSPWSHVNYTNMKERIVKEPWKTLKLVNKTKDVKNLGRKKVMFFEDHMTNDCKTTPMDTCSKDRTCFLPSSLLECKKEQTTDQNSLSLAKIKTYSLSEKIQRLLINCIVIPFDKLVSLIDSNLDEEFIVKILQKFAMLVQGCWVVKSEVLYPTTNDFELAILHDFISFLFTKSPQLKRHDIISQIKFPLDSLMLVLRRLAKFDTRTRVWHFLYSTDESFIAEHETIITQMDISWQMRKLQIFKNLNLEIDKFREKPLRRGKQTLVKKIDDKVIKRHTRKRKTKI